MVFTSDHLNTFFLDNYPNRETQEDAVRGYIPAMRTYLDVFTEAVSSWEGLKISWV